MASTQTAFVTPLQKRTHPRFAALSKAMLVTRDGVSRHCLVEDLSSSGARITGEMQLTANERVRLLLQLPGRAPFSLAGQIARVARTKAAHGARVFGMAFDARAEVQEAAFGAASERLEHTVMDLASHKQHVQTSLSLIVADSAKTCATLVHDLMQIGHQAVAVTTALDAIEWLLDGSSHFDTAFVDTRCAHSEGCDFLRFLAEVYPQVHRVVLHDGSPTQKNQLAQSHVVLTTPWQLDGLAQIFRPAR